MSVIADLYAPSVALLPIGGHYTMGPRGAAYAVARLLHSVRTVLPIHYGTFPPLKGTPAQLEASLAGEFAPASPERAVVVQTLQPGESLSFGE